MPTLPLGSLEATEIPRLFQVFDRAVPSNSVTRLLESKLELSNFLLLEYSHRILNVNK